MQLSELNQYGYSALPDMTEFDTAKKEVAQYLQDHPADHYLFVNFARRSVTMFERSFYGTKDAVYTAKEMINLARTFGQVKAIEVANDGGMVEFWILEPDEVCRMYALFDYDQGVIKI
ncbi:MAG: hypothetical protein NC548_34105 [Lachnospiraceae bacterium]|nr:hypothetical protein [Lachnospiraceae bacterium]